MEALNNLPASNATLSAFLAIPECAENLRERYYRDARRLGLSKADADDGAQCAMLKLCQCSDTLPNGERFAPSHAFYSIRRYMRRSLYKGFTGQRRAGKWKRVASGEMEHRVKLANARGESFPDNPYAIASALETAAARVARAMGRDSKAVRALTEEDIRSLAMPDMRGLAEREPGEAPRVVERMAGAEKPTGKPIPATPGDGTEWRACDSEWSLVPPGEGRVSQARHWRRLVG